METAQRTRRTLVNVRLSEEELQMLQRSAEQTGLQKSDVLRQALRRFYADLPKPKARRHA